MKLLTGFLGVLLVAYSADAPESAKAKIARAMSAGPPDIAKSARIVDTGAQDMMVVLREGSNGFTCMPGNPKVIGDPAMCADAASMQWTADFKAHKPKPTNTVPGITYILAGATQRSDSDPYCASALDDHVAVRSESHRAASHAQGHRGVHHVGGLSLRAHAHHG
jgi:hypothetical protein